LSPTQNGHIDEEEHLAQDRQVPLLAAEQLSVTSSRDQAGPESATLVEDGSEGPSLAHQDRTLGSVGDTGSIPDDSHSVQVGQPSSLLHPRRHCC
jgi:hypothetical protein